MGMLAVTIFNSIKNILSTQTKSIREELLQVSFPFDLTKKDTATRNFVSYVDTNYDMFRKVYNDLKSANSTITARVWIQEPDSANVNNLGHCLGTIPLIPNAKRALLYEGMFTKNMITAIKAGNPEDVWLTFEHAQKPNIETIRSACSAPANFELDIFEVDCQNANNAAAVPQEGIVMSNYVVYKSNGVQPNTLSDTDTKFYVLDCPFFDLTQGNTLTEVADLVFEVPLTLADCDIVGLTEDYRLIGHTNPALTILAAIPDATIYTWFRLTVAPQTALDLLKLGQIIMLNSYIEETLNTLDSISTPNFTLKSIQKAAAYIKNQRVRQKYCLAAKQGRSNPVDLIKTSQSQKPTPLISQNTKVVDQTTYYQIETVLFNIEFFIKAQNILSSLSPTLDHNKLSPCGTCNLLQIVGSCANCQTCFAGFVAEIFAQILIESMNPFEVNLLLKGFAADHGFFGSLVFECFRFTPNKYPIDAFCARLLKEADKSATSTKDSSTKTSDTDKKEEDSTAEVSSTTDSSADKKKSSSIVLYIVISVLVVGAAAVAFFVFA